MSPDRKIRTLAICYYAYAAYIAIVGLGVLVVLLAMFPFAFGLGKPPLQTPEAQRQIASTLHLVSALIGALAAAQAVAYAWAARMLNQRRGRVLTIVLGCLALGSLPIGTALGVFTLVVLLDDAVAMQFRGAATGSPAG
jgi:hypothetical protein